MTERIHRNPEEPLQLRKCLLVVAGPNLSGKTTLATALSSSLGIDILDIDEGWRNKWGSLEHRPPMSEVYAYNQDRARPYLEAGLPVILVATYSQPAYHKMLMEFARETDSPLMVFLLKAPSRGELERRIEKRNNNPNDLSDVKTIERALEIYNHYQPISERLGFQVMEIDSSRDPNVNMEEILRSLADLRKD